ncbi:MAG: Uma2 family endonuclease, partial [Chloroflexi bacterium]|nr:Uma2 family endonuclease [Chloroflexota bacterium]
MAIQLAHYRFSSEAYHRLAETGILPPDARVELIDGEILEMSPIGRRHKVCVDRLTNFFAPALVGRAIVRIQSSIVLADGQEPEPDVALLRFRPDFYASMEETPADVLLVVEVADTSLEYDRRTKAPLYARFGIPELWIADLTRERLLVYREPTPQGYASTQVLAPGESISPLAFPALQMSV